MTHHQVAVLAVDGNDISGKPRHVVLVQRRHVVEVAAEEALQERRLADAARTDHVTLEDRATRLLALQVHALVTRH